MTEIMAEGDGSLMKKIFYLGLEGYSVVGQAKDEGQCLQRQNLMEKQCVTGD